MSRLVWNWPHPIRQTATFASRIFTLSLDDCNANDESVDADLSIDNIGSTQTGEILLLSYDPNGDAESTIGITEDGSMSILYQ